MATKSYSFVKGLNKAVMGAAIFGLSMAGIFVASAFPEINDMTIVGVVDLGYQVLREHIQTIAGTMTVGGLIALVVNYLKFKLS